MPFGSVPIFTFGSTGSVVVSGMGAVEAAGFAFCAKSRRGERRATELRTRNLVMGDHRMSGACGQREV